jgi:hypothetical protein
LAVHAIDRAKQLADEFLKSVHHGRGVRELELAD